jgi:quinol monooxygenase YgiN
LTALVIAASTNAQSAPHHRVRHQMRVHLFPLSGALSPFPEDHTMNTTATDEVGGIVAAFAAQVGDPHRPLALIGRFRVRAGAGFQIEKAFAEASVHTAREGGALAYQLHREPQNPDAFVVYERWRSLEDLEAHLRTTYVAALRAEIDAVMEGQPSFQVMLPA